MNTKGLLDQQELINAKDTAKFFALEELKEALEKQQFENCPMLITLAKKKGISQQEIDEIINQVIYPKRGGGILRR